MKGRTSSLLSLVFVAVVLLLQMAGSDAHLHGFLHGEREAGSGCDHPEHPCGSEPTDEDGDACGETCAVVLLAGGVVLTPVLWVVPVRSQLTAAANVSVTPLDLPGSPRVVDARAPPVL